MGSCSSAPAQPEEAPPQFKAKFQKIDSQLSSDRDQNTENNITAPEIPTNAAIDPLPQAETNLGREVESQSHTARGISAWGPEQSAEIRDEDDEISNEKLEENEQFPSSINEDILNSFSDFDTKETNTLLNHANKEPPARHRGNSVENLADLVEDARMLEELGETVMYEHHTVETTKNDEKSHASIEDLLSDLNKENSDPIGTILFESKSRTSILQNRGTSLQSRKDTLMPMRQSRTGALKPLASRFTVVGSDTSINEFESFAPSKLTPSLSKKWNSEPVSSSQELPSDERSDSLQWRRISSGDLFDASPNVSDQGMDLRPGMASLEKLDSIIDDEDEALMNEILGTDDF